MIDWTQITVAVAALLILSYVIAWNSKQQGKRDDRQAVQDELQAERYAALFEKYATLTADVLDVVRENTRAITLMERSTDGLPEFVRQVDRRLQNGKQRFDDHAWRLGELEQKGGSSSD